MPTMTILRAIPGAGKSTFAEYLKKSNNAVVCCADDFFIDKEGNYKFELNKLYIAHNVCREKCVNAMLNGLDVIIANTNTTDKEIEAYTALAEDLNYTVFSIVIENRHGNKNIHGGY